MAGIINLSAPPTSNIIQLGSPKKKSSKPPKIIRFLGSTKLTAALAGGLTGLLTLNPITAGKVFLGTGLVGGLLESSEKARKFTVQKVLDPTKAGKALGGIIEDPSKLKPSKSTGGSVKDKILEVGKSVGLIGAGAAAVVGGTVLAKKAISKVKAAKVPKIPALPSLAGTPSSIPAQVLPSTQSFGSVQPAPKADTAPVGAMPTINNKISVKPEINISFRKSNKFINQQVLVR